MQPPRSTDEPLSRERRQHAEQASASAAGPRADSGALVEEILEGLDDRGLPAGAWLTDVLRVRHALQEADALLRRLQEAIIRSAGSTPGDEA